MTRNLLGTRHGANAGPMLIVLLRCAVCVCALVCMAARARAQCQPQWLPGSGPAGVDGIVEASVVLPNGDLVIAGSFWSLGNVPARNIARWDGTAWHTLGNGTNAPIIELFVLPSGDLVANGAFSFLAGGQAAYGLARWDGTEWSAIAPASYSNVRLKAAATDGSLYGVRPKGPNGASSQIVRWYGATWTDIGTEIPGIVREVAVLPSGDVVVAGTFLRSSGAPGNLVARWDGAQWIGMDLGVQGTAYPSIFGLAVVPEGDGGNEPAALHVLGFFSVDGGAMRTCVARWTGTGWTTVGSTIGGLPHTLIVTPQRELLVTGRNLTEQDGISTALRRWTGTAWVPVGSRIATGSLIGGVNTASVLHDGRLAVGGDFAVVGGIGGSLDVEQVPANGLAVWDGTQWSSLARGTNAPVAALATLADGTLVAGGSFLSIEGTRANRIAQWNGTGWSQVGGGLDGDVYRLQSIPDAMGGGFYVSGTFQSAGDGTTVRRLARWNGSNWSSVGAAFDNAPSGSVRAMLLLPGGDLIVAGTFTSIGGITAANIARWNGTTWTPLGGGITNTEPGTGSPSIVAIAQLADGDIVVGGRFNTAGGQPANKIARWDGSAWHAMGDGFQTSHNQGFVNALAVLPNGDLVAAGEFFSSGTTPMYHAARWDGSAWNAMGSGPGDEQFALLVLPDGRVVCGNNIWNGSVWTSFTRAPFDVSRTTLALSLLADGTLVGAGNRFYNPYTPFGFVARAFFPCTCPADLDSDGNFSNGRTRDGAVTIEDLLYFLAAFEASDLAVDLDNGTSTGTPDNAVDINDLLFFLARFEAGC